MDLTTNYLGFELKSPIVASASPLTHDLGNIRRIEDAGGGAVVLPSLFEEQIALGTEIQAKSVRVGSEALCCPASAAQYPIAPHEYLELVRRARESVAMPIIASLNGITGMGWVDHARLLQQAGASAIEVNVFFLPADPSIDAAEAEGRYVDVLRAVRTAVSIPVAMKLSPFFSAPAHMIRVLERAGADGFVLFNRFYQPDFDLHDLSLRLNLHLSSPEEIRLPLLWIAVLYGQIVGSLGASTGVDSSTQVIKYLLAGADVVMTTSALLRHGIGHLRVLLAGLTDWMKLHEFSALSDMRGRLSQRMLRDPVAYERANYIKILQSWHVPT